MFGFPNAKKVSQIQLLHLLPKRCPRDIEEPRRLGHLTVSPLQSADDLVPLRRGARLGECADFAVPSICFREDISREDPARRRRIYGPSQSGPHLATVTGPVVISDSRDRKIGQTTQRVRTIMVQKMKHLRGQPNSILGPLRQRWYGNLTGRECEIQIRPERACLNLFDEPRAGRGDPGAMNLLQALQAKHPARPDPDAPTR